MGPTDPSPGQTSAPAPLPPTLGAPYRAEAPGGPHRGRGCGSGVTLWLFRHAEVEETFHGTIYGSANVPLSAAGHEQTESVAQAFAHLEFARVLSSDLDRARALGARLAELTGRRLELHGELRELHRGSWQGLGKTELHRDRGHEIAAWFQDPWDYRGHRGESEFDVFDRAWSILGPRLEEARSAADPRPIAVCAHFNVVRILLARCLGIPAAESFRLRIDLASACALVDTPRGWHLSAANVRSPR